MDSEEKDKYKGMKVTLFIFECVMAVLYVTLGIILLFTPILINSGINSSLRYMFGIVFGIYGVYRVYRAYIKIKQQTE